MLPERRAAALVRDDAGPGRLGDVADLDQRRQAAGPEDVRLQDVDETARSGVRLPISSGCSICVAST